MKKNNRLFRQTKKNINPINPVEISLEEKSHLIGKTISEVKFWQNTGATIIGIRRKGQLILSPGPYMGFEEGGDIILAVGDMDIIKRTKEFMKEKKLLTFNNIIKTPIIIS